MSHVTDEVLAALALGDSDVAASDAEHVRTCRTCAAEVDELVRVRSLLRQSAAEPNSERNLDLSPDPALWERIALATSGSAPSTSPAPASSSSGSVPPAPAVVTPLERREQALRPDRSGAGRSWRLLAAALVCVLAGFGIGRLVFAPDQPTLRVLAATDLAALDGSQTTGRAELLDEGGVTELRVSTTPVPSTSGYVEVWLINEDKQRMVSLGVLDAAEAVFAVPPGALAQGYRIVDLSRERYDDEPRHSGDSIVRGVLAV